MKTGRNRQTITAVAIAASLLCITPVQAKKPDKPGGDGGGGGAAYNLVVLAPPNVDVIESHAIDVDEFGNVAGRYEDLSGQWRGFYYNLDQDTFSLFDPGVRANGINNLGEMVGVDENTGEGLYWRSPSDEDPITLSPLTGHLISFAFKINDTGIIIGSSREKIVTDPEDPEYPVLPVPVAWKVNQQGTVSAPIVLPFPNGDTRGSVVDLSALDNNGMCRIVGYSGAVDLHETAVQWDVIVGSGGALSLAFGPIDIGSLGGDHSAAFDVNSGGDIVGQSGGWPFVKPSGQTVQPLIGIRKATWGYAEGINDAGTMVGIMGYLFHGAMIEKAVLWSDATTVVDLNKKVVLGSSEVLEAAFRINNSGAILASGFFPSITEIGNVGCLLVPTQ